MESLFETVLQIQWQQVVMWLIGGILIYLAIKKDMEPSLLLPMGFGAIMVNLPLSGAITQIQDGVKEIGVLDVLFDSGIANELFPLILFVGIGALNRNGRKLRLQGLVEAHIIYHANQQHHHNHQQHRLPAGQLALIHPLQPPWSG